jgi:hypothetical protein
MNWKTILAAGAILFSGTSSAVATTLHIPGFVEVNQFSLPDGIPLGPGDVMFSDDGSSLYILGGVDNFLFPDTPVFMVPVIRDASGTVTGLGAASEVFTSPWITGSLEIKPGTSTLFFWEASSWDYGEDYGGIGQRLPDDSITIFPLTDSTLYGGLAFIPAPLPNADNLLVSSWAPKRIDSYFLSDNGDGTFTPELQGFFANLDFRPSDMHFVPSGTFKDDLMIADYSGGSVWIMDIDPLTGTPVGGGDSPAMTKFVSMNWPGVWGLEFDPITNNLFITDFEGFTDNIHIIQISGFRTPDDLTVALVSEVIALNLHSGNSNSLDAKLSSALNALEDANLNNDVAAINSLQAFINAVEAQRGKKIPDSDADKLIGLAQQIIDLLNSR